ncbi:MAG: DUF86 domain-containing protein [Fimbriimonadales bacterium]|nr:DUF86 domain-containing protein [Fimbriimonadales bacterium]
MKPDDRVRLQHMLDAARDAVEFMRGRSRADLDNDRQLTLAVVKAIEIIGEAAYRVSEQMRLQYPQIPWVDIIGMRHRLVHGYYDIDLDVVWSTIQHDLQPLISDLEVILQNTDSV